MGIRWGRAIVAVLAAEAMRVVVLAVLVAVFGPKGWDAAMRYAEWLGAWVGPIAGFVFTAIGGWLTARNAPREMRLKNGVAVGVLAAVFDIAAAFAALGSQVMLSLLLLANLGRLVAGTVGGWLAARLS